MPTHSPIPSQNLKNMDKMASPEKPHKRDYDIQPLHIKFDGNDSEGSDASYESSLSSSSDNVGDAENFREEMSRFFINHPELVNQELIGDKGTSKSLWGDLATDIINEAKQQPISLQSIAKRISYYRRKSQQSDIIDLIVEEKDLLLKELEEQAKMNVADPKEDDSKVNVGANVNTESTTYFSWRKKQQVQMKNTIRKNSARKGASASCHSQDTGRMADNRWSQQKHKHTATNKSKNGKLTMRGQPGEQAANMDLASPKRGLVDNKKADAIKQQDLNKQTTPVSAGLYQNLLKFSPRTEPVKQLMEEIRKHNSSDEIGIKKIIINFLVKHRDSVQKELMNKTTLSQRISKLHIEDSKQLLLFCPIKQRSGENSMPLNIETSQFLDILQEISSGHLMKYWKLLQEKKL